ncbi:MAG: hypothetical protein JWM77_60 [Rhodospirillales bacterium]|jgi:hypothetical protein|nr:hypothetical protein [Rhodospirillales bacterium]
MTSTIEVDLVRSGISELPEDRWFAPLLRLWHEKRGAARLPHRRDCRAEEFVRWTANLAILDPLPDGDFLYRLFGSELARRFKADRTGKRFREAGTGEEALITTLREAAASRAPTLIEITPPVELSPVRWRILALPFASGDADEIQLLAYARPADESADLVEPAGSQRLLFG